MNRSKISKKPLGFIPHPSFQVTLTTNPPLQNKSDTESDYGSDGSVYNVGKYSSRFFSDFFLRPSYLQERSFSERSNGARGMERWTDGQRSRYCPCYLHQVVILVVLDIGGILFKNIFLTFKCHFEQGRAQPTRAECNEGRLLGGTFSDFQITFDMCCSCREPEE